MQEAEFNDYEALLEYCQAILNSETEDEILSIKEEIRTMLKEEWTYDDVTIEKFMNQVDHFIELLENHELFINDTTNIRIHVAKGTSTQEEADDLISEHAEAETLQPSSPDATPINYNLGLAGAGVTLALFIGGCVALKKNALKKKKNKSL